MIYALTLLPAAVLAANNVEVTTSDVRKGAAFDNIKASWGKALNIGDFKTNLNCNYDYNENKEFLKDVSFNGDLMDNSDVTLSYDVNHNFGSKNTEVKLSANSKGTTVSVDYDTESNVKEVSAARSVDFSDQAVDLQPSWLVKAKTARLKMMSAFGSDNKVSAQLDYGVDGGSVGYEVGFSRQLEEGKQLSTTFKGDDGSLDVEYVDSKFEDGATWTAKASVDTGDMSNILDATKLTLKRAWTW